MNVNGWKFLSFVVVLQSLIISFVKAGQGQTGSCFSSSFSRAIGYILRGFLIGEMKVSTVIECKRRCVIGANCLSLNILRIADGRFVCHLNSKRKESGAKEQFVPHGVGEYYGLKNKRLCDDNSKTCDSATPWHAFNQSYFKFVPVALSFYDAMKSCREEKADLASTASEEEQRFVQKTFLETNPQAWGFNWLGLNDLTVEGILEWSDGSTVSYTRFAPNMPDTDEDDEHCFIMLKSNGNFVKKPCWYPQTFICETNYSLMFT
ncbi:Hypothetical predicted protein [Paramuricea clavata]|uniref:Uncharacterized protein n=1 Tax=Paramuricea clavata TaxID=317549 RepID=A0A7D9EMI0_PARCT|nr:Hypothetical predicted protein [Paramuricea clavata]